MADIIPFKPIECKSCLSDRNEVKGETKFIFCKDCCKQILEHNFLRFLEKSNDPILRSVVPIVKMQLDSFFGDKNV